MARELEPDDPRYIPDDLVQKLDQEREMLYPEKTSEQHTKDIFRQHGPAAAAIITEIALHGTTERVRLDAAKYITERVIGRVGDDTGATDPLSEFFGKVVGDVERYANKGE